MIKNDTNLQSYIYYFIYVFSNISWNPYNKNMLASSDYEGTVQVNEFYITII